MALNSFIFLWDLLAAGGAIVAHLQGVSSRSRHGHNGSSRKDDDNNERDGDGFVAHEGLRVLVGVADVSTYLRSEQSCKSVEHSFEAMAAMRVESTTRICLYECERGRGHSN